MFCSLPLILLLCASLYKIIMCSCVKRFFFNFSTPDDGYILYAALANKSLILSNDEFGSELHRVNDDDIAKLMKKWLKRSLSRLHIDRPYNYGRKEMKLVVSGMHTKQSTHIMSHDVNWKRHNTIAIVHVCVYYGIYQHSQCDLKCDNTRHMHNSY